MAMLWRLVRRDPAFRVLGVILAILIVSIGVTAVVRPMISDLADFMGGMAVGMYGAVVWLAGPDRRAAAYDLALPIPARQLWMARMIAIGLLVLVPALLMRLLAALGVLGAVGLGAGVGVLYAAVALMFTLTASQCVQVNRAQLSRPLGVAMLLTSLLVLVGAATTEPAGVHIPGWVVAVLAGATLALGWWNYRRIPASFQTAAEQPAGRGAPRVAPRTSLECGASRRVLWRLLLAPVPAFLFCVAMLQTLDGQWPMAAVYSLIAVPFFLQRGTWLFALPIARWRILAWATVPLLAMMSGGLWLSARRPLLHKALVALEDGELRVPIGMWAYAGDRAAPEIRAAWGETLSPPVQRVLGARMYNPYAIGRQSTPRFVDWQFERATEAVYGRAVSREEAARRGRRIALGPSSAMLRTLVAEQVAVPLFFFWLILALLVPGAILWKEPWHGMAVVAAPMMLAAMPLMFFPVLWTGATWRAGQVWVPLILRATGDNIMILVALAVLAPLAGFRVALAVFERVGIQGHAQPAQVETSLGFGGGFGLG